MSHVILKLQDVDTCYGKICALRGISLTVEKGQIVTLLGANGAGKSTVLRTISGLVSCTAGSIEFMGKDITRYPAHEIVRKGLIHVPEGRRIFRGMTIRENLELGSFTLKDNEIRQKRISRVFDLFPILQERQKQDAGLLSGGEQQMLAIGRALMSDIELLLLDEPSMGLAPFLVMEIMRVIKQLNTEGVTILLVEQNAKAALKLADYGYVLETGTIVMENDAHHLRHDERTVKAYLGN